MAKENITGITGIGVRTAPPYLVTEERLRFYCLSPAEQDAYAARAPEKELSHG